MNRARRAGSSEERATARALPEEASVAPRAHTSGSAHRRASRTKAAGRLLAGLIAGSALACASPVPRGHDCPCACEREAHACQGEDPATEHEAGHPKRTFLVPGLDHGLLQSPINILSSEAATGRHRVTVHFSGQIDEVEHLAHTVQVDFHPGSTIEFDDKTFDFVQLHFHTPSEHLVDGVTYPMEMHLVNIRQGTLESDTPEYLVFAFLVKMGAPNRFIDSFIDYIPPDADDTTPVELNVLAGGGVFNSVLAEALNHYYYYRGSLTTPPYTESVNWAVLKHIFEASPEQILRINELEGDNARHIQKVNRREVSEQ